jgi:hypothetical protein
MGIELGYAKPVDEEDPEKRRLRQLAETAGSLAPSRIGAWATPGLVVGESWSEMSRLARAAFVLVFAVLAAVFALFIAALVRAGQVGEAVAAVAFAALMVVVFVVGQVRRRRSRGGERRDDAREED